MAKNRGMYVDYGAPRGRRRRGPNMGMLCGILVVIILAVIFGVLAYKVSGQNLEELPVVPSATPVPATPTPVPTPSGTPTPTPTPTPTNTPTPMPTSPETGLPCTPTPTPSPTPTPTPAWDDNYLVGWTDTRQKPDKVIGAYTGLKLSKAADLEKWLELADTTELNAVVIDVKGDAELINGRVTYHMDNEVVKELGVSINQFKDMKELLKTLKEHGIYTIARVVCFKDNFIDEAHPEYMIYNQDGTMYTDNKGDTWINPYRQDSWPYLIDIAEQAAMDGFDEICFDYIRFQTNGLAKADFGPEAEGISREQIITAFTKYACNRLKPTGVFVSASVYGSPIRSSQDAASLGQNYIEMSRYLDYICPMVYPSHYGAGWNGVESPVAMPYELLLGELKACYKKLSDLPLQQDTYAEVRPWLQAFSSNNVVYDAAMIREQVQACYDVGYTNWMLWNAGSSYKDGAFLAE